MSARELRDRIRRECPRGGRRVQGLDASAWSWLSHHRLQLTFSSCRACAVGTVPDVPHLLL